MEFNSLVIDKRGLKQYVITDHGSRFLVSTIKDSASDPTSYEIAVFPSDKDGKCTCEIIYKENHKNIKDPYIIHMKAVNYVKSKY